MATPVVDSLVSFVVALLVGGLAIYVGARIVVDEDDYRHALVTAVIGAIAWALTSWIPIVGTLVALVVWIWVINWRYRGGWVNAAIIGLLAWLAAGVILWILNAALGIGVGAFGVPCV